MVERKKSTIAVLLILVILLLAGWVEVRAMPSLEEQRRQRERAEDMRHQIEIERIRAQALIEAARYTRNYY